MTLFPVDYCNDQNKSFILILVTHHILRAPPRQSDTASPPQEQNAGMKSIVSRSVEEGERGGRGCRNSVTFFDPLWRSLSFPLLPLLSFSTSLMHVPPCRAPVCRYEFRQRERERERESQPAHFVSSLLPVPKAYLSNFSCLSPHQSASISPTKLQTLSGTKWRQWWLQSDKRCAIQRCFKANTCCFQRGDKSKLEGAAAAFFFPLPWPLQLKNSI